jgi:hypothetical protein
VSAHATRRPCAPLGSAFAVYGIALFVLGTRRMGVFDRALGRTSGHESEDPMLLALLGAAVIFGLGTLALIVSQ